MKIANNITELIGRTPLVNLAGVTKHLELQAEIVAKVEFFNPGGSVKDRVALSMIEQAEKSGELVSGGHIIEPTSGNTGVGLALVCASRGYKLTLTMPESMSIERRTLLKAMGANIVLTPAALGMSGAIAKANELKEEDSNSIILGQFDNPANPLAHKLSTAKEIIEDTDGQLDIFVSAVGTGGTINGTASVLKEHNPDIMAVAVEPAGSPVLSGGKAAPHKIQGIGAGFIPKNYDPACVDKIITVSDDKAIATARMIAKYEGIMVGISSGAALAAAIELAQCPSNSGKRIVILLPDTGERYISTQLYDFENYPLD